MASALAVVHATACICDQIPDRACFAGEACDPGGGQGGGSSAGGGLNSSGGGPSGGGGVGNPTCLKGLPGDGGWPPMPFDQLRACGVCEDFACAGPLWPRPTDVVSPSLVETDMPVQVPGGPGYFSGGIELLNGLVLATPSNAQQFLLVDVTTPAITSLDQFDLSGYPAPYFGAAVLGCDGSVYALPDQAGVVVRVTPGELPSGFMFSTLPFDGGGITGAVVIAPCDLDDAVHIAASATAVWYELTISSDGGFAHAEHPYPLPFASGVGPLGTVRTASNGFAFMAAPSPPTGPTVDTWFVAFPMGISGVPVTVLAAIEQVPFAPFTGGTLTGSGLIAGFDLSTGTLEEYGTDGLDASSGPLRVFPSWPLARGDGFIYLETTDGLSAYLEDATQAAEVHVTSWDAGFGPATHGLVNAQGGALVAVPGTEPVVRIMVPDTAATRPSPALTLSPFLNKR